MSNILKNNIQNLFDDNLNIYGYDYKLLSNNIQNLFDDNLNIYDYDYKLLLINYMESLDKQINLNNQIVHMACMENNTELVIWLIQNGFNYDSYNTPEIAYNENIKLLQFYIDIKCEFCPTTPRRIVDYNNKDNLTLLKLLFDNNLVCSTQHQLIMIKAMTNNYVHILEYLTQKHNIILGEFLKTLYKSKTIDIYDYDLDFKFKNNKINDITLCWLWTNGYKWSEKQAKKYNNQFMLKFVEINKN